MKICILSVLLVCLSACSFLSGTVVFQGVVVSVDTSPLAIDGSAEVVVTTDHDQELTFYVNSCQIPNTCVSETINKLVGGNIGVGDRVQVSTFLWSYPSGEKYLVKLPNGYIKKI